MNSDHAEPNPTPAPRANRAPVPRPGPLRLTARTLVMMLSAALWMGSGCKPEQGPESNLPAAAIPAEDEGGGGEAKTPAESGAAGDDAAAVPDADPKGGDAADKVAVAEDPKTAAADGVDATATADDVEDNTADTPAAVGERKLLILGDSMAATGFGVLLQKKLDAHPQIRAFRKGKSASGLARPDYFDWMDEAKRQIELREPDIVVVIMGGNDGQDLTPRKGQKRVNWQTPGWEKAYGERMDAFLAAITAPNRRVIWLGLPHMEMRSLEKKLELIREIQRLAIERYGAAGAYVDTTSLMADADGNLPRDVRVNGKLGKLREEDGIHFTMAGSEFFADRVYPEVLKAAGIE